MIIFIRIEIWELRKRDMFRN